MTLNYHNVLKNKIALALYTKIAENGFDLETRASVTEFTDDFFKTLRGGSLSELRITFEGSNDPSSFIVKVIGGNQATTNIYRDERLVGYVNHSVVEEATLGDLEVIDAVVKSVTKRIDEIFATLD